MPWSKKIPFAIASGSPHTCGGMWRRHGEPHFDADGTAMVGIRCGRCGRESMRTWRWKW